ncbi:hypothetical protein V8E36_005688 [Tilletia maclaganii]
MLSQWISILSLTGLAMALPISKRGFSGTATFYDAGLGNCGTTVSPNAMVVALNTAQYGSTSTVSSHCFKTVTITNLKNGNTHTAMVQDSCPTCSYGDLDMSVSLFSALNNGNLDDGIFPISWSFSGGGNGGGNSNGGGSNNYAAPKSSSKAPAPKPSSKAPKPTSTKSPSRTSQAASPVSSSPVATPTEPAPPSFLAPTNTTLVNGTVSGTPAWWSELDTSCWTQNLTLPANVTGVVIAPSKFANSTVELSQQCGKWINATNPDNGKSVLALVVSYIPGGTKNQIALTDGYNALADIVDEMPAAIANVEWGIIAGCATVNATATAEDIIAHALKLSEAAISA